jgi:tripartite-type tricarboxylate transporter receptor subunit TctC
VKEFDAATWFMLVAPAKTPAAVVDRLYGELRSVMGDPDLRQEFVRLGVVPINSPSPEELKQFVRSEIVRWGKIVRDAGLAGLE